MRHAGLGIIIFFLTILVGCASLNNSRQVASDYQNLLAEQIRAHNNSGFITPFRQVIDDFATFKRQLYLIIKEKYANQFSRIEFGQIEVVLAGVPLEGKNKPALAVDVFRQFQGQWRGEWIQNRQSTIYDQIWFTPYELDGGLIAQKVIIREWDGHHQKPFNAIAAINTYNPANNRILGAVDVHKSARKSAYAPHLGFYIDSHTFIWIGCIAADSNTPSYSFYFEKISTIDQVNHYRIRGVGFNWNRKSKKITNPNWCEGHYVQIGTPSSLSTGN